MRENDDEKPQMVNERLGEAIMIAVNTGHWGKAEKLRGSKFFFRRSQCNYFISIFIHTCGRGAAHDGELPWAVVIVVIVSAAPGGRNYLNNAPSTPTTCEPLTPDP